MLARGYTVLHATQTRTIPAFTPSHKASPPFGWYSLRLPAKGWPGWVDLDDWLYTQIGFPHRELNPGPVTCIDRSQCVTTMPNHLCACVWVHTITGKYWSELDVTVVVCVNRFWWKIPLPRVDGSIPELVTVSWMCVSGSKLAEGNDDTLHEFSWCWIGSCIYRLLCGFISCI